ncbi:protein DpdJ, partial [Mariniblastus sp.]|nr:protein DpdJ [Mariniblastus sp.]
PDVARHPHGSLANFRRSADLGDDQTRDRFGQRWGLCEWLGHSLDDGNAGMRVDRTSSQDAGVATEAEIIVATAALEVGFNDPDVNVVIQHKAPRDSAQFLQRKGRAGRRIEMRPWTLISLSDYGRDRLAWQSFDILFDPELPPRELPVRNRYVLRIQAVFACFDWISRQLRRQRELPKGSVYRDFSAPSHELGSRYQHDARKRQQAAAKIIEDLLVKDEGYDELVKYLCTALDETEATVESLMWEPPRALMTAALPTLLRRLVSNWKRAGNSESIDYIVQNNPLPEFVPGQLFGDLNLPEVNIISPSQQRGDNERQEPLPILQAMKGFAPGKVSRRFGVMNAYARHWVEPQSLSTAGAQDMQLHSLLSDYEELGRFEIRNSNDEIESIRCVRPRAVRVTVPERRVLDSSNAFLGWHTQICPDTEGTEVDLPQPSRWDHFIEEIRFFTHNQNQPLEVRRVATESNATISFQNGEKLETTLRFTENADEESDLQTPRAPIGIGFSIDVDGLAIRYRTPENLIDKLSSNPEMLRCLRVSRFKDLINEDQSLDGLANSFQRQWLAQIYLSALTNSAIRNNNALVDAWQSAQQEFSTLNVHNVLSVIFQSIPVSESDDPEDSGENLDDAQQRLQQELGELLNEPLVQSSLRKNAETLWEEPNEDWLQWTSRKFRTTLGAAILEAIQQVCSDLDAGDLLLDIDGGPRTATPIPEGLEEIWITERTIGGGGVVECLLSRFGEDPRRFFELVENALRQSDYEIADEQLTIFLDWLVSNTDSEVRDRVANLRNASTDTHDAYATAFETLKQILAQKGLFVCHSVIAAISNRILRPGSTQQTDELLHGLIAEWNALESKLMVEIDPRVFAYQQSERDEIDQAILQFGVDELETDRRQWRFNAIFSLLWPRGGVTRSSGLSVYNPFANLPTTEHDLVRMFLSGEPKKVAIEDPNWRDEFAKYLVKDSLVILDAPSSHLGQLRDSLLSVMTCPTDTGSMLVHPSIRSIERRNGRMLLTLSLSEAIQ